MSIEERLKVQEIRSTWSGANLIRNIVGTRHRTTESKARVVILELTGSSYGLVQCPRELDFILLLLCVNIVEDVARLKIGFGIAVTILVILIMFLLIGMHSGENSEKPKPHYFSEITR
jgi:hypothetical protein